MWLLNIIIVQKFEKYIYKAKKKILFVSCNGLLHYFLGSNVLCMFHVDWEVGGQKKPQGKDFFE